ncbi:ABC transporter ATP-binding protein [Brumimicrobium oceani]|nr:ABC transporter ATP-binding protein [Brumimicrobium oceani]
MLVFKNLHIGFSKIKHKKESLLFSSDELLFNPGEFVAVIGPNGSGKTTLFNTILGEQEPLSGAISIDRQNWKDLSRMDKAKHLSFVPSKFGGVEHLTVYNLVAMGRAPYTNMLNKLTEKDQAVVKKVLNQLGLSDFTNKNTVTLSDGERQIAMIGKALAQEAKIMILDEPTAFLDYNNRRKVLQLLKDIAVKNNQLIFISSHDLELCFEYCSRVIAIDAESQMLLDFKTPFNKEEIVKKVFK